MADGNQWREFFASWPAGLNRSGVIITSFGEQIPFGGFLLRGSLLLVERRAPDSIGARQVVVPFSEIHGFKVVDVVKPKVFAEFGFEGELPKR